MVIDRIENRTANKTVNDAKSLNPSDFEEQADEVVIRLYELGLRPGLEIQILGKISFGTVTVIQYGHTRLALNEEEMSCLHGRS